MAIWKAWALTPRVLVNGRWEMQLTQDFPTANVTDISSQMDDDAHLLPLCLVVGIAQSDAALNAVKANSNHLVLAQLEVTDPNGDTPATPRNTTLDDAVTAPQVTAFNNYLAAHGIDTAKYSLNSDLAVGRTRQQVLTALYNRLQRWLA